MIQRRAPKAAEGFKQKAGMIIQQGAKWKDSEAGRTKLQEKRKHGLGLLE